MSTGTYEDFAIYTDEFQAGAYEALARNTHAFNDASRNALRLVQKDVDGHFAKEAFFQQFSNLITRRDIASAASVEGMPLTQGETVSVKLNRKIGPVDQTLDSFRKAGLDPREFSYQLGLMIGQEKTREMLDAGLIAAQAAIDGTSALVYDATGESTATMTHLHLVNGLAGMGDVAGRVTAWVMHSKVAFDLLKQSITDQIANVADMAIFAGTVASLGRPIVVTDSAALVNDNGSATDTYNTLGLVAEGVLVQESEEETIVLADVTGHENLIKRLQGEYAFNVNVKGFQWSISEGGVNPTNAALGASANWSLAVSNAKNAAGVQIVTQ